MTVIAAVIVDGVPYMAGDRRVSWGSTHDNGEPKIRRMGGALVGFSGASLYHRALRKAPELVVPASGLTVDLVEDWLDDLMDHQHNWAASRGHGAVEGREKALNSYMLVATSVGLWSTSCDGSWVRHTRGEWATGSGDCIALGSMYTSRSMPLRPEERVRVACSAAVALDSGCGGTIDVLSIPAGPAA